MPNASHKLIYEFNGSVNLNTSPIDITNLDGDSWDYFIDINTGSGTANNQAIFFHFNNDTGTNWRRYTTTGTASTVGGNTLEATTIPIAINMRNRSSCARFSIVGKSGEERYINQFYGYEDAGDTELIVRSSYWKNTIDNLTSIQVSSSLNQTDIIYLRVYQVPKLAQLANFDLIDEISWSSESTTKSFTGLNGDNDEEYFIEWKSTGVANLRINNDSGSNYKRQRLTNSSGTIGANTTTSTSALDVLYYDGFVSINATTGRKRLIRGSTSKTAAIQQSEASVWYSDTVTNITQLNIVPSGSITATAKLYKKRLSKTLDRVPMTTVVDIPISGDFSAGVTISGIEGDRIEGAMKIEIFDFIGNTDITMQANSITSNTNQQLWSNSGSVVASKTTPTKPIISNGQSTFVSHGVTWLYPKSGQFRPCLNEQSFNENSVQKNAIWIDNSVDELTSLLIQAVSTVSITATIRISVTKGTKQASNSWQITIN